MKTILVTGATSGIGKAFALHAASGLPRDRVRTK